ncbi:U-box domain-containing protein 52 isoform X2 [Selaginella moellendorffii]|nr:U-box domain-containing protein 52 isoform X2 [Selaginella moellendorffii]|eukprot:XP_002991386.2 U-box domain-containing protein 52 isoform X2 [Selaginella moellendorffii]
MEDGGGGGGGLKVAVGIKSSKRSIGALRWAFDNAVSAGDEIYLVHVQHPIRYVPTPVGNLAVAQLSPEKVAQYAKTVQDKINAFVEVFKSLCDAHQIKPNYVQVENDSVQKGLLKFIHTLEIQKLVLGSAGRTGLTRKLSGPGTGEYVAARAPSFCSVCVIAKDKLVPIKALDDSRSISSASSRTSDSERSSSSSSQGSLLPSFLRKRRARNVSLDLADLDSHPPARLHGLPEGLGQMWNVGFLSRFLSSGSPATQQQAVLASSPPPENAPLDEISGARVFSSPFRDRTGASSEEIEIVELGDGAASGTMALISHKLGGSSKSGSRSSSSSVVNGGALTKLGRSESSCSSGIESSGTEDYRSLHEKATVTSKADVEEKETMSRGMAKLDVDSSSTADREDDSCEGPSRPPPQTRRKSLQELSLLSQRTFKEYEYAELEAATKNFSLDLKLGEGGYGLVFKGKLHGRDVAIKVLKKEGFQRTQEFQHEVELLGRIQHPHMVVLLGCCSHRGCLVYEFMANGSLDDRLFCKNGTPPLPWYARFRIAAEVASALYFLHNLGPEPVVHRDLKPANILLDHNNVSKVGDVGLAKLVPERLAAINSTYFRDTTPVGTFAYIDPEYQRTGLFGPKSDVYALGIVILQLLTGRGPVGVHAIVEEAIECGNFSSVLDSSAGDWPVGKAEEVACLALQCAEMRRRQRPMLETVLPMLDGARNYAENCAAIHATNRALAGDPKAVPPSIFLCPIFREVMQEPVVAADGYTYEYEAIRQWFQAHDTSPLTNLRLEHKQLTPHHALNKLITEWKTRAKV